MKLVLAYSKRTLHSLMFWIALAGVIAITVFGMTQEDSNTVLMSFDIMLDLSTYRKFILLFAMLPFGTVYCREWNEKLAISVMARIPVKKHLRAYIILQFSSAFLITFIGLWISIGLLRIGKPLHIDDGNYYEGCFNELISLNKPITYLLFRSFHYSISIAAWSMSGLAMSSVFVDPYLATIAPLVFSYGIELITIESSLPNLWYLSLSYTDFSKKPAVSSAYIIFVFLLISFIFALVFYYLAKRRAHNEIH